jgi:hypothetical protein
MRLPAAVPTGHPLRRSDAEMRDLLDSVRAAGRRDGHDDGAHARGPIDPDAAEFLARTWILGLCAFNDDDIAPLCAAYCSSYRHAYAGAGGQFGRRGREQRQPARQHASLPFSDREVARLSFMRWLYQTGRLDPAQNDNN